MPVLGLADPESGADASGEADTDADVEEAGSGPEVTRSQSTSTVFTRFSMASRSTSFETLALSATTHSRPSG